MSKAFILLVCPLIDRFDQIQCSENNLFYKMPKRRKSLESSEDSSTQNLKVIVNVKGNNILNLTSKVIAHFMPRRRFSQGAVSALKDILENLDVNDGERGEGKEGRAMVDPEEFSSLSREEQLKVSILYYIVDYRVFCQILEQKSWVKNIDFNPDSSHVTYLSDSLLENLQSVLLYCYYLVLLRTIIDN